MSVVRMPSSIPAPRVYASRCQSREGVESELAISALSTASDPWVTIALSSGVDVVDLLSLDSISATVGLGAIASGKGADSLSSEARVTDNRGATS